MDTKSLYAVIPNGESLHILQYYLDKREVLEPPSDTFPRMAEQVLTLNTFECNGKFYKQTGGMAMGSRIGPNYACLFVGYVEERMLSSYAGTKPDLYKPTWMMWLVLCYAVKKTSTSSWNLLFRSTIILSILGLFPLTSFRSCLEIITSPLLYTTRTRTATPISTSAHLIHLAASHPFPYCQFLRLCKICSGNNDFESEPIKMEAFMEHVVMRMT